MEEFDAIFKAGFLRDVYEERPRGSPNLSKITTRFPPEPNGFLHLGHAKAIAINFGFAHYHKGDCFLRFDDTNPGEEEERFFIAIQDIITWLGFKPVRVTYSSDHFERLYKLAKDLIEKDGAYVCHCSAEEIKRLRGGGKESKGGLGRGACVHRDRPIEESLMEFRAMRDGKYAKGEAVLRMKQDLEDGNPQMWDLAAYRIAEPGKSHHFRTKDAWRIYPTYDFTHCLCDSFESITHSLCTTEFELSRVSYEWLCDKLEVYKPMQREHVHRRALRYVDVLTLVRYGRLQLEGVVLSKRKLKALVEGKHVRGWDDPRLYTLIALRRRGIPPGALLAFVNELGVSKATTVIRTTRFEQSVRSFLEQTVPRLIVVLDPLEVEIEDLPEDYEEMVNVPFAKDPSYGTHDVPFTRTVYVERADFREVDSKDFFRMAPGKPVGLLRVPYPILANRYDKDESTGKVKKVYASYMRPAEGEKFKKPKAYIHWVARSAKHQSPIHAEVRTLNPLFDRAEPDTHPNGFLAALNPDSEEIFANGMIETGLHEICQRAPWPAHEGEQKLSSVEHPESVRFQGMRVGYFCLDSDSTAEQPVLNRIVTLKEDTGK